MVWLIGRYAFKFPNPSSWRSWFEGFIHNIREYNWYKYEPVGNGLSPVLFMFPSGLFIVMHRAIPLTNEEFKSMDYNKVTKLNSGHKVPCENKICSFGKINGEIKVIDYGDRIPAKIRPDWYCAKNKR